MAARFRRVERNHAPCPAPSQLPGAPALARKVDDLAWTLEHLYETYGPVVDVGYRIPIRVVHVMGVEANRYILGEHPENFTWAEAFSMLEVVDGPTALVLSDGDEHRRRRLVQLAFGIKRVDAHLDLAVREIDRTLDGWLPGRRLDAFDELRSTVRRIVVRALFGEHLGDVADHIGEQLEVRDTIGDRPPTVDDLRAMPLVDGVVRETLRLWSPAAFSGRRAVDDFELYGYTIPGGRRR